MTPIRNIAVVGCGYWGKNLVRNFEGLGVLRSVVDTTPEGRATCARIAPDVDIHERIELILADPQIAGIALATPAETHHPLALRCLRAGKDVFVEKPLALNCQQGLEMKAAAEERQRVLMVGHLLEYHPAVLRLADMINDGQLGAIHYIYSNRLNFGKIRTEENVLWSFAPHDLSVIVRLFGEMPSEVTCFGGSYITENLSDVTVSGLLFPSGRRAHVFVNWLNPFKEQKLVVVGSKKMAVFDDVAPSDKLRLHHQRVLVDAGGVPTLDRSDYEPVAFEPCEPLQTECAHFVECIATRKPPRTDADNGLRVLRILEALQNSLQQNGRPVSLAHA